MHVPPYRGKYPDQFRSGADVAGMVETFPGIRLDPRQYEFIGEGYLGILRIDVPLTDYHRIALSYSRADGVQFGEFTYNVLDSAFAASQKPMLVKLVRPGNLLQAGPNFADAWKLLVQSVYPLGYSGVIKTLFQLDVFQRNGPTVGSHSILGHPLMTILGLDRFSTDGTPTAVGDGIFDYRPERTIDQTRGYIIVPYLRPFDDGIRRYFVSIGQPVSSFSTSLMPQIYDVPPAAQDTTSTYVIQGSTLHQ
jgi:cell surface protein SprA